MGEKKKLQEAKRLGEQGQFQQAWELLFGKAEEGICCAPEKSGFELAEGDGRNRTLGDAEAYWKAQGCEMARLSHYYAMAGHLTPEQLESIRNFWLITDRLDYRGRMVLVNGGDFIECPVYEGALLADVLGTQAGLAFIQALCGTEDGADAIMLKLEMLFGVERGDIRLWTSGMDSRKAYPSRAAGFIYYDGEFRVNGGNNLGGSGRSRGVRRCEAR